MNCDYFRHDCDFQQCNYSNCTTWQTIDLSNISFINDIWLVAPVEEILIKIAIMLPVAIWGIFGNLSLLYIIIRNSYLHSPTNVLIANMAFADFILLFVHPWIFLAHDFFQNYPLGEFGCRFEGAFECKYCGVLAASVTNLVAISYDRLNSIAQPQEKRLTINKSKIIMITVWLIGLLFATPLFIFRSYRERQWSDFLEQYCTEDVILTNIYWHIIIIIIVWIPLGTMLVCYITLFIKLKQYEAVVLRKMKTVNVHYKKQVAKMMFIVVMAFVICRFPLAALIFYRNQLLKTEHIMQSATIKNQVSGSFYILWFVSRYLIFVNAAINPVIYGLTSEKFRKAFQQTPVSKYMFPMKNEKIVHREIKNKPKQIVSTKCNIFLIFKKHKNKTFQLNDTVITNNDSQAPIVITN